MNSHRRPRRTRRTPQHPPSPTRLFEQLTDRYGALEAVANTAIQLARHAPEHALPMDLLVAGAVLEFGSDLRAAGESARAWREAREHARCG